MGSVSYVQENGAEIGSGTEYLLISNESLLNYVFLVVHGVDAVSAHEMQVRDGFQLNIRIYVHVRLNLAFSWVS